MINEDQTAAWTDGHPDQIEWFSYREVDRLLGVVEMEPAEVRSKAAELFGQILNFCWSGRNNALQTATVRFVAITAALRPDLTLDKSYKQLGESLGVTKQTMSKEALAFADKFRFKITRGRSNEARGHMASAQMGHSITNRGGTRARTKVIQSTLP